MISVADVVDHAAGHSVYIRLGRIYFGRRIFLAIGASTDTKSAALVNDAVTNYNSHQ